MAAREAITGEPLLTPSGATVTKTGAMNLPPCAKIGLSRRTGAANHDNSRPRRKSA